MFSLLIKSFTKQTMTEKNVIFGTWNFESIIQDKRRFNY